jgi:cytohesin
MSAGKRSPLKGTAYVILAVVTSVFAASATVWGGEIHDAIAKGDIGRVRALVIANPQVLQQRDARGRTPLLVAARSGQKEIVELLLAHKADANERDNSANTALIGAAAHGHAGIVQVLLASGANVNATNDVGWSALHAAVDHVEVTKVLLAQKADVNARTTLGWTPLHYAAQYGDEKVVRALVAGKADIDAKNLDGQTPLVVAVAWGKNTVVKTLLEAGANVEIRDRNCRTPLLWALLNRNTEIVEFLLKHGAHMESTIHFAVASADVERVEKLLKDDPQLLSSKDDCGQTPLHYAARRGSKQLVELLLAKGAQINAQDSVGYTPLVWAIKGDDNGDHKDVIDLIEQHGGQIDGQQPKQ